MTTRSAGEAPGRDWLAFDRSDRWGLTAILGLAALAAFVGWVIGPVVAWVRGEAIPVGLDSEVSVPALEAAGVGHGWAAYDAYLADPSTGQRVLAIVPGLLWVALVLAGAWLVLRIMRAVAADDPFHSATVRRLRMLAGLLVLGAPIACAVDLIVRGLLLGAMDLGGLTSVGVTLNPPWLAMVGGLVVALLAEAFKAGGRLRQDLEGLV
ncbi:MAG: DUF2975 domain-containing protein [Ornithinibacter sp.]